MGGDQPAGGQGGDEKLFCGLFWGAQAKAQLDIPSQDYGHAHIKLLNALLANEILTLQVFQSREGEYVGRALYQRHDRSALPASIPPPDASEESAHPQAQLATIHTQGGMPRRNRGTGGAISLTAERSASAGTSDVTVIESGSVARR